jgi:hypothetical protein
MKNFLAISVATVILFCSCGSTQKIQTAIAPKDTAVVVATPPPEDHAREDSIAFIRENYRSIIDKQIGFRTFSAKLDVDFRDTEGKKNSVTVHLRMFKDSIIWVLINGPLGIEGLRAIVTNDSVKVLNKQDKIYTVRSVTYLQEVTELPLDLVSLQNLLIGNPVFLDSNIVSYQKREGAVSLLSIGNFFKNLYTIGETDKVVQSCKLDDLDGQRNRTCYLTYADYDDKKGVMFSRERNINVAEKKKLDINLKFKQYEFNETLSFPFNVSEKYKRN